jgi:hypothetical protein
MSIREILTMKKISLLVALVFLLVHAGLFTLSRDCSYAEMAAMHEHHEEDGHHQHAHGTTIEPIVVLETVPKEVKAQEPATLIFSLKDQDGKPIHGLSITHDRLLHVVIVGQDFTVFGHVHAEDSGPITKEMIRDARFPVTYTFPKAGRYLIAVDSALEGNHFSKYLYLDVSGEPKMGTMEKDLSRGKNFGDYRVALKTQPEHIKAGEETTLTYTIEQIDTPVTDLEPYLSAPMHLAIVLADLNNFIHAHGELPGMPSTHHPAGHIHGMVKGAFGPEIEAHVIFPVKGLYTIFSEVKHKDKVILMKFMVEAE